MALLLDAVHRDPPMPWSRSSTLAPKSVEPGAIHTAHTCVAASGRPMRIPPPVPSGLDPNDIAGIGLVGVTAYEGLRRMGALAGRRIVTPSAEHPNCYCSTVADAAVTPVLEHRHPARDGSPQPFAASPVGGICRAEFSAQI